MVVNLSPFDAKATHVYLKSNKYAGTVLSALAIKSVSKNDDIFVPSQADCANVNNHAIVLIESSSTLNYFTMLNSWGPNWAFNGIKKIRPCSNDNFAGIAGRINTY